MYNSQIFAERVKKVIKEKNLTMENLNSECNLSKNAISSAGKSTEGMKARNLYVIADYLDVSV
ncbi:MAG: helix-turn-helix domain-containing protein, partial [Ruminococcus sp.]|nr:helix-turn-helix domain-containing protein [Ruminococcus sp.]